MNWPHMLRTGNIPNKGGAHNKSFHPKFALSKEATSNDELVHWSNSFVDASCCSCEEKRNQYVPLKIVWINEEYLVVKYYIITTSPNI
jgi:hypothetical protein